ncbi:hypothetical protein L6475_11580 [Prevotella sp. E9-3]|uniref:hypothetical protein n=1 Tax=Prevotella sp. E9-3 TaxID=2913621 RepID=UPI001EDB596B|nr:hypothetical protein [Prevotella sp. E9-3]UKK47846.1 hypothetical protein L6475_11580 [Prevotella sp. E9-3]
MEEITVYIIESLHEGDLHTGENLHDYLRQKGVDYHDYCFVSKYLSLFDKESFLMALQVIAENVEKYNEIPILQIECHGDREYLLLSSNEHVEWVELFDSIRVINEKSRNRLLLNLSMCNGEAVITEIDPKERAPFRAVIGPEGEAKAIDLQNAWIKLYSNYYSALKKNEDFYLWKIASSCGLLYFNQEFIFDAHFDTPNLFPGIFKRWIYQELAEWYRKEGPLMLDVDMYIKWKEKELRKVFDSYRPYYCFEDTINMELQQNV